MTRPLTEDERRKLDAALETESQEMAAARDDCLNLVNPTHAQVVECYDKIGRAWDKFDNALRQLNIVATLGGYRVDLGKAKP
jgi:hypothetical protein